MLDASDIEHAACKRVLGQLRRQRRVTSLAVLTEAVHRLRFSAQAQRARRAFVAASAMAIADCNAAQASRAAALMERFENLPMDFADATLVVLADQLPTTAVVTLDRRDFGVDRVGRRAFRLLPTSSVG